MDTLAQNSRWIAALGILAVLSGAYLVYLAPPSDFPSRSIVVIARGTALPDVANELASAKVVKHPEVLRYLIRALGAGGRVQAGPYLFDHPENLLAVAVRITTGQYGLPSAKITFPEGNTVRDMAAKVADALPLISAGDFTAAGKPYEGYLFPDTYIFPPDATAASIVSAMRSNFDTKLSPLMGDVQASGRSLSDTIILASLVEKEARTTENRKLVAGVLLNRLRLHMPLQVDAVFGYIYGRDTYSPSLADLKADSPYNTYIHTGLPPGPIDNPGLDSIQAAIHPTKTNYLYYLTDTNGVMHYATTYAEHLANQQKYLQGG